MTKRDLILSTAFIQPDLKISLSCLISISLMIFSLQHAQIRLEQSRLNELHPWTSAKRCWSYLVSFPLSLSVIWFPRIWFCGKSDIFPSPKLKFHTSRSIPIPIPISVPFVFLFPFPFNALNRYFTKSQRWPMTPWQIFRSHFRIIWYLIGSMCGLISLIFYWVIGTRSQRSNFANAIQTLCDATGREMVNLRWVDQAKNISLLTDPNSMGNW
jgi:hypothetical protein